MRTSDAIFVLLTAVVGVPVVGCKKDPPKQTTAAEPATSAPSPAGELTVLQPQANAASNKAPEPLKVALAWDDPPGWKRSPRTRPMRAATYEVPSAEGDTEKGEMAVFYFGPGQGGDVDGNVERWAKQFGKSLSDVQRTNREVHGLKQHVVEIDKGDYSSDMMGQGGKEMKGWAMLAAIVQAPSGSYFFKLTGPHKSVQVQRDAFYKLLDSVKPRD